MDDKAVASAISDFNAAAKAMGYAYDAELRAPPWSASYTGWARTRTAELLRHLTGWRPVADEDERALTLRDRAIGAACRLWTAIQDTDPQGPEPTASRHDVPQLDAIERACSLYWVGDLSGGDLIAAMRACGIDPAVVSLMASMHDQAVTHARAVRHVEPHDTEPTSTEGVRPNLPGGAR